jgi:hypothetical protein
MQYHEGGQQVTSFVDVPVGGLHDAGGGSRATHCIAPQMRSCRPPRGGQGCGGRGETTRTFRVCELTAITLFFFTCTVHVPRVLNELHISCGDAEGTAESGQASFLAFCSRVRRNIPMLSSLPCASTSDHASARARQSSASFK